MGCCTSGPRIQVLCSYKGETATFGTSNVSELKDLLRIRFPELIFKSFKLLQSDEKREVNSMEDLRQELLKHGNKANLHVDVELPPRLEDSAWTSMAESVFILAQETLVLGTGFFLTQELALCTAEDLNPQLLKTLQAVFPGEKERKISFKSAGFCGVVGSQGKVNCALVKLEKPQGREADLIFKPSLETQIPETGSRILYIEEKQEFTLKADLVFSCDKTLREGSTGAPVIGPDKDLLGVYLKTPEEAGGLVLSGLMNRLLTLRDGLKEPEKTLISKLFPESKTSVEDEVYHAIPPPRGKDAEIRGEEPVRAERVDIVVPEEVPALRTDTIDIIDPYFAISLSENSIQHFDEHGTLLKSVDFPVFLTSGFNCVFTTHGLFITTCDSNVKMSTFLLENEELKQLKSSVWTHQFHTSVWFRGKVMVISGLNTEKVEQYHFDQEYWEQGPNLRRARANGTAIVIKDAIYLVGGMGRNLKKYKTSVLTYDGNQWKKLGFALSIPLRNFGALVLEGAVLIFGGKKRENDTVSINSSLYQIDLNTGEMKETGVQDLGSFGGFSTSEVAGKWITTNEKGVIFEFQSELKRFRVVRQ